MVKSGSLAGAAVWADAVDLDAVADDVIVGGFAHFADDVFDVGEGDVLGGAAADADEVVVVGGVADAVGDGAVTEDEAAYEALVHKQFQCPIDGGASDGGELAGEGFGGEVVITAGDGFDHELARRGNFEALVSQFADQALGLRCRHFVSIG